MRTLRTMNWHGLMRINDSNVSVFEKYDGEININ